MRSHKGTEVISVIVNIRCRIQDALQIINKEYDRRVQQEDSDFKSNYMDELDKLHHEAIMFLRKVQDIE